METQPALDSRDAYVRELEWSLDISRRLSGTLTLNEVLDVVYEEARSGLGYDRVGIDLLDHAAGIYECRLGTDEEGNKLIPTDRRMGLQPDSPLWRIPGNDNIIRGIPYYTEDAAAECPPELLFMFDGAMKHNIMVPLKVGEKVTGMISVDNLPSGRPIYREEVDRLVLLAAQVSRAVENARLREAHRESEAQFRRLFAENPQPMWVYHRLSLRFLEVNDAAIVHYGYTRDEFLAMKIADIRPVEDVSSLLEGIEQSTADYREGKEWRHRLKSGRIIDVAVSAHNTHWGADDAVLIMSQDVTERKSFENRLQHQALHDALTGLPNRTLFVDRLDQALRATGRDKASIAVLLMDLNDFKEINDTFGHHIGDLALQYLAGCVRGAIRESDTVARLGGDEFAFVLPGVDAASVAVVVHKLREAFEKPFESEGRRLHLSPSVGIAISADDSADASELLRRADVAMYMAKNADTHFAVYQAEDDRHGPEQAALLADLHDAVRNGELFLHFQPKVDTRTGQLVAVEALARWDHPKRGMIPPDMFIEMAERTGLIKPLTLTILDQTLQQCRLWHDAGHDVNISVNLSAQSLHDPDFDTMIADRIEYWGVSPKLLTLEITESAVMSNPDRAMGLLCRLRDLGITISIDDFGTGYSSLSYLKQLPVSEVKIDRSFVTDVLQDPNSAPIVRSIVELGHNLGLHVVAEGVEDDETMALLHGMGCDLAQGYGVCRPTPAAGLDAWLGKKVKP